VRSSWTQELSIAKDLSAGNFAEALACVGEAPAAAGIEHAVGGGAY